MALKQSTIVPTQTISGAGSSVVFSLSTATMMQAIVTFGTIAGTITAFDLLLESCNDATEGVSGTNFAPVLADLLSRNGTDVATPASKIASGATLGSAQVFSAQYKHIPAGTYRFRWNAFSGGGSIPITIQIGAK